MLTGISRAVSSFLAKANQGVVVRSIARQFGSTRVQSMPCRYDDPVVHARKALLTGHLDRYAFPKWQDLMNHFARQGDENSMDATAYLAYADRETVVFPPVKCEHPHKEEIFKDKDFLSYSPEAINQMSKNKYDHALRCLYSKQLDMEYFKSWQDVVDFFYDMDDSRLMTVAIDLKHRHQSASRVCDTEHFKNVQKHIGQGDYSVS